MPTSALVLALAAAFIHALWNLLLARAKDVEAATAVALIVAEVVFLPVAIVTWHVHGAVVPFLVASGVLQLAVLRAARDRLPRRGAVRRLPGRARDGSGARARHRCRRARARDIGGPGDRRLSRRARRPARARAETELGAGRAARPRHRVHDRRRTRSSTRAASGTQARFRTSSWTMLGRRSSTCRSSRGRRGFRGCAMRGGRRRSSPGSRPSARMPSFLLALQRAAAAPVAAVRETSVVIAALLARWVLREPVGAPRIAGAAAVAGGIALLALT